MAHKKLKGFNKSATNLKLDNDLYKKVGWAIFSAHHQDRTRWAEKIAHPTRYILPSLKLVANKSLLTVAIMSLSLTVQAGEKEELLKLRNTTTNLIKLLVEQGVLSKGSAEKMIKQAALDAEKQVQQAKADDKVEEGVVRVAYVPEFVKDQIRQQVRSELREDVVADVLQEAKTKQWGVPNALPEWTRKFKLYGDMRLRYDHNHFAESNFVNPILSSPTSVNNFQSVNKEGGFGTANGLENINQDRDQFRARFRLGVKAKITEGLEANVRLASGNSKNPLSTNQTMGNSGQKYEFNIDRAFLKYEGLDSDAYNWMTLQGGRIVNPFKTTDLVFDRDLSFEGFASTFRYNLAGSDSLYDQEDQSASMYMTLGAFPLEEFELSTKDKWMLGGQVGTDWEFNSQDKLAVGVAFYKYLNTEASPRTGVGTQLNCTSPDLDSDASLPEYLQKGNSMTPICYSDNNGVTPQKFGIAPEFEILNITASYDLAMFAPIHVKLTGDYAKNFGFDKEDIQNRVGTGVIYNNPDLEERTDAWQMRLDVGWPSVLMPGRWNSYVAYKYIESDAILDAFADSNFHLGGTNAKGWVIEANYGVVENAWLSARWISTDQIDGPKVGIDVLLVDFNAKF